MTVCQPGSRDSYEIPFLRATTATSATEKRNSTTAEKEPRTRGQSTPDTSADITHRCQREIIFTLFFFFHLECTSMIRGAVLVVQRLISLQLRQLIRKCALFLKSFTSSHSIFTLTQKLHEIMMCNCQLPCDDGGGIPGSWEKRKTVTFLVRIPKNTHTCRATLNLHLWLQPKRGWAQSCSISFPGGHCTGSGTRPSECPGLELGRWPDGGSRWQGEWQQEIHYRPGRGRRQHRGRQETLCRANATRLSAAGEQGWGLATPPHLARGEERQWNALWCVSINHLSNF